MGGGEKEGGRRVAVAGRGVAKHNAATASAGNDTLVGKRAKAKRTGGGRDKERAKEERRGGGGKGTLCKEDDRKDGSEREKASSVHPRMLTWPGRPSRGCNPPAKRPHCARRGTQAGRAGAEEAGGWGGGAEGARRGGGGGGGRAKGRRSGGGAVARKRLQSLSLSSSLSLSLSLSLPLSFSFSFHSLSSLSLSHCRPPHTHTHTAHTYTRPLSLSLATRAPLRPSGCLSLPLPPSSSAIAAARGGAIPTHGAGALTLRRRRRGQQRGPRRGGENDTQTEQTVERQSEGRRGAQVRLPLRHRSSAAALCRPPAGDAAHVAHARPRRRTAGGRRRPDNATEQRAGGGSAAALAAAAALSRAPSVALRRTALRPAAAAAGGERAAARGRPARCALCRRSRGCGRRGGAPPQAGREGAGARGPQPDGEAHDGGACAGKAARQGAARGGGARCCMRRAPVRVCGVRRVACAEEKAHAHRRAAAERRARDSGRSAEGTPTDFAQCQGLARTAARPGRAAFGTYFRARCRGVCGACALGRSCACAAWAPALRREGRRAKAMEVKAQREGIVHRVRSPQTAAAASLGRALCTLLRKAACGGGRLPWAWGRKRPRPLAARRGQAVAVLDATDFYCDRAVVHRTSLCYFSTCAYPADHPGAATGAVVYVR